MFKFLLLPILSLQLLAFDSSDVTVTNFPSTGKTRGEAKMDLRVFPNCQTNHGLKSNYGYENYDSYTLRPKDKPVIFTQKFNILSEAVEYGRVNSCTKVDVYTFSELKTTNYSEEFYGVDERLYSYFFHCRR